MYPQQSFNSLFTKKPIYIKRIHCEHNALHVACIQGVSKTNCELFDLHACTEPTYIASELRAFSVLIPKLPVYATRATRFCDNSQCETIHQYHIAIYSNC